MRKRNHNGEEVPVQTHTAWVFTEEKEMTSRDKELLMVLIGATVVIIAVLLKMYFFGALIVMATSVFIYLGRQKPKKLTFSITNIGLFMNDDFIPKEKIHGYNIIDVPGDRAHLIVQTEKIISLNEILPIYDVSMKRIGKAFRSIDVQKNAAIRPNVIDAIANFI